MNKPSEGAIEGLSSGQANLLQKLDEAGKNGIRFTELFASADQLGFNQDEFADLINRGLIVAGGNNCYVHARFYQEQAQ